jgi:DNA polymerase, archaea type
MQQGNDNSSAWVYGWDDTPGIVSVWADRRGHGWIWRRTAGGLQREAVSFRPWLYARDAAAIAPLLAAAPRGLSVKQLSQAAGVYQLLVAADAGSDMRALLTAGGRSSGDSVLQPGPVEQYLMQSGRNCLRGMHFADLVRLQFALECTHDDPQYGRITRMALRCGDQRTIVLTAADPAEEPTLLRRLCGLIMQWDPDVIEQHGLFSRLLPFLCARAAHLRVPLLLGRRGAPAELSVSREGGADGRLRYSIGGRELLDTLDAARREDFVERRLNGYGLSAVAAAYGLSGSSADDPLLAETALVQRLSQELHEAAFALTQIAPRRLERVARAGPAMGILEPLLLRAYLQQQAAPPLPPQLRGARFGDHRGGASELYASGIARNVIKADIASLYPSLIVSEQIGPACDTLGAFTAIVGRLRSERLSHKRLARAATLPAAERRRHAALSAAMKLIINSAYGYLGAGRMALFADAQAADRVTAAGRAQLQQLTDALRRRGVQLLEADTDGVFAALPANWDDQAARRLVAAVGAELPAGITLELEGRYAAMYSHQRKNYALLGFDGRLTLRGVAFRSRRSEPLVERFLHEGLTLLMRGDAAALRDLLELTCAALRNGQLTPADVAVTARLRKTPAEYAAAGQREGVYEALRNAGQTDWHTGDRVQYYVAADGSYQLLRHHGPPYHALHYERLLRETALGRLRMAFDSAEFAQLTRAGGQIGLFDTPTEQLQLNWIDVAPAPWPPGDESVAATDEP